MPTLQLLNMACVSSHSPVPQRSWNGHPNERQGEMMARPHDPRLEAAVAMPQMPPPPHHHHMHHHHPQQPQPYPPPPPPPQMAPVARGPPTHHRHVITQQMNPAQSAFQQVKSPISQCIDTIIGAAEVVEQRGPLVEERNKPRRKKSKKASSRKLPRVPVNTSGILDPLERRLEEDQDLHKKLILTMALQRPRQPNNPHPTKIPARVIGEGFYWKEYPILEDVLYEHMEEYYEWSTRERQSKHQQAFNNILVEKVRNVAYQQGYQFDPVHFSDKRLRDRIRCFYKTHLQNAKKRLGTMKKHIGSEEHRAALEALINQSQNAPKFENRLVQVVSTSSDEDDDDDDEEEEEEVEGPKRKRARSN